MRFFLFALCAATLLSPSAALGTEGASFEMGRALFLSADLGTNGKSCATCHPSGRGLENASGWDITLLKEQVNTCIGEALQGETLDPDSTEMNSLIIYIESL